MDHDLQRFVTAQAADYSIARDEISAGRKRSHWVWYIFPQLRGLGRSDRSRFYGISGRAEAEAYLAHPVLGPRLEEMFTLLLTHRGTPPDAILGAVDAMKVRSSATLFYHLPGAPPQIAEALSAFWGTPDPETEAWL